MVLMLCGVCLGVKEVLKGLASLRSQTNPSGLFDPLPRAATPDRQRGCTVQRSAGNGRVSRWKGSNGCGGGGLVGILRFAQDDTSYSSALPRPGEVHAPAMAVPDILSESAEMRCGAEGLTSGMARV